MTKLKKIFLTVILADLLFIFGLVLSFSNTGKVDISKLENINGVPYPTSIVSEQLAHADIQLKSTVFAKEIILNISFIPYNIDKLEVGVRENSFWLSYPKQLVYIKDGNENKVVKKTITIPLTNKLQEKDGSVDLMFFATTSPQAKLADQLNDSTYWKLLSLTGTTNLTSPSLVEVKNYIKSIITKEKAL